MKYSWHYPVRYLCCICGLRVSDSDVWGSRVHGRVVGGVEGVNQWQFTAVHAAAPSIQRPPIFTLNLISLEEDNQERDVVHSSSNWLQKNLYRFLKTVSLINISSVCIDFKIKILSRTYFFERFQLDRTSILEEKREGRSSKLMLVIPEGYESASTRALTVPLTQIRVPTPL